MKIDFTGRTALITGATRGIGSAVAECLYKAGANLILTGTKIEETERRNLENKKKGITTVRYIQVDFSDLSSTETFLRTLDKFERIDICVNNAGINKVNDYTDTSVEDFNEIHEVNLKVPYRILKVLVPKMLFNNYGRIVNIASIWSVITRPGRAMYTSSKNALVGLTKTLAVECASQNVLVNAVSPGFTLTELTRMTNTIDQLSEIERMIPAKRLADPTEIAKVTAFLCSDLNTYLTGQNIIIDGGYTNV